MKGVDINMAENEYKISLGVDVDVSDIQTQINSKTKNNTVPIKVEIENLKDIKEQLQNLGKSKGNKSLLSFDTTSLENSLKDVSTTIKDIKASIGSLDSGVGMKSLLSSINQISTALDKASGKFEELTADLKTLGSKDFSINLGINMGGSNPVAKNAAYGSKVRNDTLPQLKQQMSDLVKYYNNTYKKSFNEIEALQKLISGTKLENADFYQNFLFDKNNVFARMNGGSLSSQMQAYKEYISMFKEAASLKGLDISGVTSGFSKSADDLIKDAQDIQSGAKEMEDSFEKLKQVFGGNNLNVEGLSVQLDSIVSDLGEIKTAIHGLSSGVSIDGLTQSFNRLSETLDKLVANFANVKNVLGDGFSNSGIVKAAQQTGQKIGETVSKSAKQALNLDDVIDKEVSALMNEYAIAGDKSSNAFKEIRQSLVDFRNGSGDISKVTSAISNNMKVANDARDVYKDLYEQIKLVNVSGAKVHLPDSIKQEYGDDFESMRKQLGSGRLGNAFTTGQGMDFESFVVELNSILGQTIDLSHGAEAAFGDLVSKVNSTKAPKFLTGDDLFRTGNLDMGNVVANVSTSLEKIENAEEEIARASGTATTGLKNVENDLKQVTATAENTADAMQQVADAQKNANSQLSGINLKDDITEVDEFSAALSKLKNIQKNMDSVQVKLSSGLDTSKDIKTIQVLENQLESLRAEFNETQSVLNNKGGVSSTQFQSLQNETKNTELKLEQLEAKVTDVRNNLAKKIFLNLESGEFATEITKVTSDSKKLSGVSEEVENNIKQLNVALSNMKTASANGDVDGLIQSYKEFKYTLETVENQLKQNKIAEQDWNNVEKLNQQKQALSLDMDNWLKDNSAAAKKFGDTIRELQIRLESCNGVDFGNIKREFQNVKREAESLGLATQTLGDRIKSKFKEYSAYFSVAEVFMYTEQALRSMFEQVKLIDSAMTELKKVTDETDESYNQFLTNAASRAKEIGTTIDGLVSSTADFAKLGYSFEDAQGLAEVANIYAVVGDEIEGVEGATESLISTLTAFKDEMGDMNDSDFAMSIVDKMNEVANRYSISSGGIGEALQRSASSMAAANNTLDETISLITAANSVVQDPDAVGRLMPTIKVAISVKLQRWTRPSKDFIYNN